MSNEVRYFKSEDFDYALKITKDELPDPQCFHANETKGGMVSINKVGISKLDFPLNIGEQDAQNVKASITAHVSLDNPEVKGINMSRLVKIIYEKASDHCTYGTLLDILNTYKERLPAKNAYIELGFDFLLKKRALREEHVNFIYYPVTIKVENENGIERMWLELTYTYSSACPCSKELAEYSTQVLNVPAISHSQRSVAKIQVELDVNNPLKIAELVELARTAQPTELLPGVVTRVSEFSFAQLVASTDSVGFVEDVLRRFYAVLSQESRIKDFTVSVDHQESLNQNHATGCISKLH